ncbi:MAG: Ig-like domain-containing protein, partial [Armatimonadetes bacterium]|nr:Ig-like domain-containing protein [Armatimonadota bacterium]
MPANGEKAADPGITTLEITFSEPMQANKYYLGPITGRELPWEGMPPVVLSPDGRTFSVPISLKPNRKYGVAINAPGH